MSHPANCASPLAYHRKGGLTASGCLIQSLTPLILASICHFRTSMARKQAKNTYRPNMKAAVDSDPKKGSSTLFTGKRVRDLVMCGECLKETMNYVCGSDLFPSDHELHQTVYVRTSIECNSPIEAAYYSYSHFPLICYYCGGFNAERDPELLNKFRSVTPMCSYCKQENLQPVTKMPIHQK